MTATTYQSHFYTLTMKSDTCSPLGYNSLFSQELPSRLQPVQCHMTSVLPNISNTSRILIDRLPTTIELIIDGACSDHMFNIDVQMTNYKCTT